MLPETTQRPNLPQIDLHFTLHPRQWEVFSCPTRFRVLVAGRRFGKTELAIAEIIRAACAGDNRVVWYIGPTKRQAKRIMWRRLKRITRPHWACKPDESELRIDLKWGSSITVSGGFNPEALRGDGLDFVVLDEVASLKPETWDDVLRPSLADRQGRALFMGTPLGRNHLHRYFLLAQINPDWASFQFTTQDGGLVKKSELASAAHDMDPNKYRQELEAEFTSIGKHPVYYAFKREIHLLDNIRFDPTLPLIWALDFNVDPMCMLLIQRKGNDVFVLREIVIKPNATTELACEAFLNQTLDFSKQVHWTNAPLTVNIYGDASGNHRHTSGTATDWTLIRVFFRTWTGSYNPFFFFNSRNPLVRDRVNCVNVRLFNQHGDIRLYVHPSCKELTRDLEEVCWAVDANGTPTGELDKRDRERTHASDALGYYISHEFPLRTPSKA